MGQKVNPHGLRVGKSENILKIVYTAQEFLEQKSNVLLIV